MTSRLAAMTVAAAAVLFVSGCKKTYEDPIAFLEKYLIEDYVNKENPPERVKSLELKGPELLDVHMGVRGIYNAACATVRYTPISKDAVYVRRYKGMTWDAGCQPSAYGPSATVLSREKLAKDLSDDVQVCRAKSDTGVFVLVNKLSGSNTSIPDLDDLELLNKDALHAGLKLTSGKVLGQKTMDDRFFNVVDNYMRYSSNGQLQAAEDKDAIQAMADACAHILSAAMRDPSRFKQKIDRREFEKLSTIESVLRRKGATFTPPAPIKGKMDSSVREEAVSDSVNMGRFICRAITMANIAREANGLSSIWPHLSDEDGLSDDQDDIAGVVFKSSSEYFAAILRLNGKRPIVGIESSWLNLSSPGEKDKWHCDWIIMSGVTDEMPDDIPVMISANVDYSRLPFTAKVRKLSGEKIPVGRAAGRSGIPWGDDYVVVVRKNGKAEAIKAAELTPRRLLGKGGAMQFRTTVMQGNKTPRYLDVK